MKTVLIGVVFTLTALKVNFTSAQEIRAFQKTSIKELHNIEKGSNGRYLVGGNFNSKLDFLSIHDSCTTFTSAFFAEMDSSSNNLKYNKVSSSGYIRVIKAGLSGSSGSWGPAQLRG